MYRGEFPGFHWDEEKRKYFKIEASHYAHTSVSAKYTRENIQAKQNAYKKRKREEEDKIARKRTLVQRVPISEVPKITRLGILSEIGHNQNHHHILTNERSHAYMRSWEPKTTYEICPGENENQVLDLPQYEMSQIAWDKATDSLILGIHNRNGENESSVGVVPDYYGDDGDLCLTWEDTRPINWFPSPVASIEFNPKTRTLVTAATGDRQAPIVHISQLKDPIPEDEQELVTVGSCCTFRPDNVTTVFSSAINPWVGSSKQEIIAVGTSHECGVVVLTAGVEGVMQRNWRPLPSYKTWSDALGLDWLSPNLLAVGHRDSSVHLYDVRSRSGVKRMKHAAGIMNLKRAGELRFVVAGMGSQMAMYDIRALRAEDAQPKPPPKSSRQLHGVPRNAGLLAGWSRGYPRSKSKYRLGPMGEAKRVKSAGLTSMMEPASPLLTFQYENDYDLMLGMDVSTELGVVAAAECDGGVRVSSLATGKTVKEWKIGSSKEKITSVRFIDNDNDVPKLLASCAGKIIELGLNDDQRDEQIW